jgi:phosphoribosylglycinamide formyltransferase-1
MHAAESRAPRIPIVVLISGRGSNMQAIAERARDGRLPVEVRAVISDKETAGGLALAQSLGIETRALSPKAFGDRAEYDRALAELVDSFAPQLVVLAGFMRILSPKFVNRFRGRLLNIHPSLLPKYPGLHTHRRALEAGDREHGASVHFVTEELDGGPVIIQASVEVRPNDTEATLSARVQRQEHIIYPQAIEWFALGRLKLEDERIYFDGEPLAKPFVLDARER